MIKIVRQDREHQYDEEGNPITTWNEKYCSWVINMEYEKENIDWGTDENGITEFPRGSTLSELNALFPNATNNPKIEVSWFWDEESYKKAFGKEPKGRLQYTRIWEYLDYTEEEAIEKLGHHCGLNTHAYQVKVVYNGKEIFNGRLE